VTEAPIQALARLLDREVIPYALIGGHAVNTLLEPRLTRDIDEPVVADAEAIGRLRAALEAEGFRLEREFGMELPFGPDFLRFVCEPVVVEVQTAKTRYQHDVVRRAVPNGGVRVASAEDLIVLKLIADWPKDQADLRGLARLPSLDWSYFERCAEEWSVQDRLLRLREVT
jgi:hypothetical protein